MRHLEVELTQRAYRAIGDVAYVVRACTERGACVGIATGNVRAAASIKLQSAGLLKVFSLARGGFGCDAEQRADIIRVAIGRCAEHVSLREGSLPVVVVGDTPHDIEGARAVGARAVGVGTTESARRELTAAGADAVVETCGDALIEAIF
ncbi:MAG: hypothetical protein NVS3B20_11150 [Polyangiales bacterium]